VLSFQTAILLLRIDDIVSGSKKASTLHEKADNQAAKQHDEQMQAEQ
jgi:hypothetical protein